MMATKDRMLIMFIAGVFALVFGKIHVAPRWYLHGKFARLYGLTLLVAMLPVSLMLSVIFLLLLPSTFLTEQFFTSIINLGCTVAIILALAYPFKVWQGKSLDIPGRPTSGTKFLIFMGIIVVTFVGVFIFGVARGVTTLGKAIEASRENRAAGEVFGSGKRVDDCIDRFLTSVPNDTDLEVMVQVTSFNSGCTRKASDFVEWCRQFKTEIEPRIGAAETDAYCNKRNLRGYTCTLAVTGAIRECEGSR